MFKNAFFESKASPAITTTEDIYGTIEFDFSGSPISLAVEDAIFLGINRRYKSGRVVTGVG